MSIALTVPSASPTAPEGFQYLNPRAILRVMASDSLPVNPYVFGYGARIPTPYAITLSDNRVRKVWAMCYGNSASHYVIVGGRIAYLDAWAEGYCEDARDNGGIWEA